MPLSAISGWCWALVSLAVPLVTPAWLCQLVQHALDDTQELCSGNKVTPARLAGGEYDNTQSQAKKKKPTTKTKKKTNKNWPEIWKFSPAWERWDVGVCYNYRQGSEEYWSKTQFYSCYSSSSYRRERIQLSRSTLVFLKTPFSISDLSRTSTVPHLHLGRCLHFYFCHCKRVGVKAGTNMDKGDPLPHHPVLHLGFGNLT